MPYIILECAHDAESAHIISDPEEPDLNLVLQTEDEAIKWCELEQLTNPKIISL